MTLRVILPDGSLLELPDGATPLDAAKAIGPRLARAAVAAKVNDVLVDENVPLADGDVVSLVTLDSPEGIDVMRHTASHVMAQAVLRLFPGARYAIGPTIENGFYYDLELPRPIREDDLERIEKEMRAIVKEDCRSRAHRAPRAEASSCSLPWSSLSKWNSSRTCPKKMSSASTAREFHRPLPRSSFALDRASRCLQAAQPGRRLLARGRSATLC